MTSLALGYPAYRRLWASQFFRGTAQWTHTVTLPILLIGIGASPSQLGLAVALQSLPVLGLAPLSGTVSDHLPRRWMLVAAHSTFVAQALISAALIATENFTIAAGLWLALMFGVANTIEMPSRHSLLPDVVPPQALGSAVVLQQSAYDATRFVGPVLAAVILGLFGPLGNYLTMAVLGLLTLLLVAGITTSASLNAGQLTDKTPVWRSLTDTAIWQALLLVVVTTSFGFAVQAVLPIYVTQQLEREAESFATLMAAMGLGALAASLPLARGGTVSFHALGSVGAGVVAASILLLLVTANLAAACVAMFLLGAALVATLVSVQMTIHTVARAATRGSIVGIYLACFHGGMAVGAVLFGVLVETLGLDTALVVASALMLGFVTVRLTRHRRRKTSAGQP